MMCLHKGDNTKYVQHGMAHVLQNVGTEDDSITLLFDRIVQVMVLGGGDCAREGTVQGVGGGYVYKCLGICV